jgi:hypothetical protein
VQPAFVDVIPQRDVFTVVSRQPMSSDALRTDWIRFRGNDRLFGKASIVWQRLED